MFDWLWLTDWLTDWLITLDLFEEEPLHWDCLWLWAGSKKFAAFQWLAVMMNAVSMETGASAASRATEVCKNAGASVPVPVPARIVQKRSQGLVTWILVNTVGEIPRHISDKPFGDFVTVHKITVAGLIYWRLMSPIKDQANQSINQSINQI